MATHLFVSDLFDYLDDLQGGELLLQFLHLHIEILVLCIVDTATKKREREKYRRPVGQMALQSSSSNKAPRVIGRTDRTYMLANMSYLYKTVWAASSNRWTHELDRLSRPETRRRKEKKKWSVKQAAVCFERSS